MDKIGTSEANRCLIKIFLPYDYRVHNSPQPIPLQRYTNLALSGLFNLYFNIILAVKGALWVQMSL